MDNFAAAAALRSGAQADASMSDAVPAAASDGDAPMSEAAPAPAPAAACASDVERIAAALGYEMCSDSDEDEALSLVGADAAAHAEWVDEDERFDGVPRTEHELLAPPPAPALSELSVGAAGELRFVGVVESFMVSELTLIVRGASDAAAVVEDSAFCLEGRAVIGAVAEVFGPVREPFYVVRLRDAADAAAVAAHEPVGKRVFVPGDRVAFVRPEELSSKGCDASNVYDEELDDHQQEFSDDEAQANTKALAKKRARDARGAASGPEPSPPPPAGDAAVYEGPPLPP